MVSGAVRGFDTFRRTMYRYTAIEVVCNAVANSPASNLPIALRRSSARKRGVFKAARKRRAMGLRAGFYVTSQW